MSYNLIAEGVQKLEHFANLARTCTRIEMFPIEPDAIGIALPLSRVEGAFDELDEILGELLQKGATVHDLMSGDRIASRDDFAALHQRIG